MKKLFLLLLLFASIISYQPAYATSFSLVPDSEYFGVSDYISAHWYDPVLEEPIENEFIHGSVSGSSPVSYEIEYYGCTFGGSATYNALALYSYGSPYNDGSKALDISSLGSSASSHFSFKPNFAGDGDILFNLDYSNWVDSELGGISIRDRSLGAIFDVWWGTRPDSSSINFNYDNWDPTHIYEIWMMLGDDPVYFGCDIYLSNDMEFSNVPEPATILLLGAGLIAIVGIRRRIKKIAQ